MSAPEVVDVPTVLFVHPPKTGGCTVQAVLQETMGDLFRYFGHRMWRADRLRRIAPDLVLGTCRHPAARFVSAYYDLSNARHWPGCPIRRTIRRGLADTLGFKLLAKWRTPWDLLLRAPDEEILAVLKFKPQVNWLAPGGSLVTDRLLRCETLEGDLVALLAEFGLPALEIPRVNTTEHPPWEDLLTAAMLRRIERLYSDDYRVLGYPLSSSTGG